MTPSLRTSLSTAFLIFALFSATPARSASVFDGKWELDKKQPAVPGAPEDFKLEIKEEAPKLIFKSTYKEPKNSLYPLLWLGVMTYNLELSTDGSQVVNQIGPFAHSSKTTLEGNKMTTDFVASMENGKVTGQWVRTVSSDGKEMTWAIQSKSSDGRLLNQTLVFKKK